MKKKVGNEIWEVDAERELDKYFPKGDKRRGEAIMVLASAKLEEQEKIKELKGYLRRSKVLKIFNANGALITDVFIGGIVEQIEQIFGDKTNDVNVAEEEQ
jgi:hypothetical protein